MKLTIKIELPESKFEDVCKITIAGMLFSKDRINKKTIIAKMKCLIHQKGEFYINFTDNANDDGAQYYSENEEEVCKIYDKYFC